VSGLRWSASCSCTDAPDNDPLQLHATITYRCRSLLRTQHAYACRQVIRPTSLPSPLEAFAGRTNSVRVMERFLRTLNRTIKAISGQATCRASECGRASESPPSTSALWTRHQWCLLDLCRLYACLSRCRPKLFNQAYRVHDTGRERPSDCAVGLLVMMRYQGALSRTDPGA
jgi:hypothetical protein